MSKFIWTDRAKEQLRAIGPRAGARYPSRPHRLRRKGQVKKLKGSGDLRLRVGNYRVRFEVAKEETYRILRVHHRKEAYRS